jgi:pentatricopeptide repeat protein
MSEGNPQNYEKEIVDLGTLIYYAGNGKWNDARAFFRKMSSLNVKVLLLSNYFLI